jgi:lysophospholipid acyltransferase (LPLAT)-like uncharacterized protein
VFEKGRLMSSSSPIDSPVNLPPQRQGQPPKKRKGGVIVPHTARWHQRLGAWIVVTVVRMMTATIRFRYNDHSDFFNGPPRGPALYCFWHNRLALCTALYHGYAQKHNPSAGVAGLVSASRDGAFLSAIFEAFNVQPVRGSSSRRGPQALLELTTWAERGYDLAITPDGPRGPCYSIQPGVMSLAQVTGLPIVPFSYHLNWKVRAKSWDRFQIPFPFARCDVFVGKPIVVPREATDEERAVLRQKLEQALRSISKD